MACNIKKIYDQFSTMDALLYFVFLSIFLSGIKTSILYTIQAGIKETPNFIAENRQDLCASIQHAIVTILIDKLTKAIRQTGITQIAIAGGVSANSYLRKQLKILAGKENFDLYIPKFEYCTDNAAMIAIAGYFKFMDEDFATQSESPYARLLF